MMNLPNEFVQQIESLLKSETDNFFQSLEENSPVSIRINPSKIKSPQPFESVKWSKTGYYLNERPPYTFDPLFHAGCYYPQEASSMFVEQAIDQYTNGDIRILDLCAAPGGKSTHLLSLISSNSLLIANEVIRSRANILAENISKSGYPNAIVTNNDPSDIGKLKGFFDVILVDAPCSGEGMFRKDNDAINEWSPANVNLCAGRQQRILADIWNALKPGGILIYSTCTYNLEEDENNVQWICSELGAEALSLNIPSEWNITGALIGNNPVYRFMPHKTKGEGFFLAVLRKHDGEVTSISQRKIKDRNNKAPKTPNEIQNYILQPDNYTFLLEGDCWYALPTLFKDNYSTLKDNLKIVSFGVCLGEVKGKDFIPSHSLAMSNTLNKDAFKTHNIEWRDAISYLRKEALIFDQSVDKGYILLMYNDMPLGFVKNIGNRANNLYPQEWRIRTSNIPDNYNDFIVF